MRNYFGKEFFRTQTLLDQFFNGYSSYSPSDVTDDYDGFTNGNNVLSPYPPHPRAEVIKNVQQRNPGMSIGSLSDWDIIDLYFRNDPGLPVTGGAQSSRIPGFPAFNLSTEIYEQRIYFTFHSDRYIQGSARDMQMEQGTRRYITDWLVRNDDCSINWDFPSDTQFKNALLDTIPSPFWNGGG